MQFKLSVLFVTFVSVAAASCSREPRAADGAGHGQQEGFGTVARVGHAVQHFLLRRTRDHRDVRRLQRDHHVEDLRHADRGGVRRRGRGDRADAVGDNGGVVDVRARRRTDGTVITK